MGKRDRRRPLGRCRHRWEGNIKIDLEIGWNSVGWIELAQGRDKRQAVVTVVTNRNDANCMIAHQIVRPTRCKIYGSQKHVLVLLNISYTFRFFSAIFRNTI